MSRKKVGIVGARGHTGAELIRLIDAHENLELAFVSSRELCGQRVADQIDGFAGDIRYEVLDAQAVAAKAVDAIVLALPNGKAAPFVGAIEARSADAVVVDLSADYRFDESWYYGLPELTRSRYIGQRRISNPGCYATAMQLAIAPLKDELAGPPQCFGVSGYSGAGTTPSDKNNIENLRDNLLPYSLVGHVHEREVSRQLGLPVEFMPHVASHFRGITMTVNLWLRTPMKAETIQSRYREFYANEALVHVVDEAPWVSRISGRHHAEIGGFALAAGGRRVVVVATLDNLLKGAATQALQNLNIALGIDEYARNSTSAENDGERGMSDLLWQKSAVQIDEHIMRFLAGDDVLLDREFFLFDIEASKAHVEGLANIAIVSAEESIALIHELEGLAADFRKGSFVLDERFEDGHSAIEARLSERLGEVGRKVHTGRSRNDQVLVASRLWLKSKLDQLFSVCANVATVCIDRAGREALPMPGYTHLQRAVVSSTAMWFAGFAEAFIDNAWRAQQALALIDANPLGTAAGYGVNLTLDREHTTRRLGFARMQISPIYAQLSRGKFEIAALDALGAAVLDLRRLAWDLSLFTTSEFAFVTLPEQYTTGSSIMPNKRNPDVIELMRASYASVAAARTEIEQSLSLPSGYQRDLQAGKGAILHGFRRGLDALALLPDLLAKLVWNAEAMRAAIEPAMYATDVAIESAIAGVPFRDAYRAAADSAHEAGQGRSPESSLAARTSPGAGSDLRLDELRERLAALL